MGNQDTSAYTQEQDKLPAPTTAVTDSDASKPDHPAGSKAVDRFQIFEQVALERLQTGSDTRQAASFLPLPVKTTALAAAGIAGLGVLWSLLARVPIQVNGTGAIVMRNSASSLIANGNGVLHFQVSGAGANTLTAQQRQNNQLLSNYWSIEITNGIVPSIDRLKALTTAALEPTQAETLLLPEEQTQSSAHTIPGHKQLIFYPSGTMLAAVADPLAYQELVSVYESTLPTEQLQRGQQIESEVRSRDLAQLGRLQAKQRSSLVQELKERKSLYSRYEKLWAKGFIPGTTILEERSRINNLEGQLLNSSSSEMSTKMNQKDKLEQAKQSALSNIETRSKLENQLTNFLNRSRIFAPHPGVYLLGYYFRNGALVKQGDEILTYSTKPPELPDLIPVFLDAVSAQQVNEGMQILLTPKGISRAEYGGIRGKITQFNKLPIPADNLVGALGSRGMATQIQQIYPAPYVAWVQLNRITNADCKQVMSRLCYQWSSGKVPNQPVRLNTLADVQITTGYQRPIEFVMPTVKKFLGLVVDNT